MRLLPRDTESLSGLAASLSLVIANYKPVPQLPSANTTATSSGTKGVGKSLNVNQFKTSPANYTSPYSDASMWGVPSILYVPEDTNSTSSTTKSSNGHQLASSTVGPGGCPLNTGTYKPNTTLGDPVFASFSSTKATMMRYRQQLAVNLGAWFVQEGWMQSSFMSCAKDGGSSEYALLSGFGTSANGLKSAQYYLEQHWDTWITEEDFIWLKSRGINTVRIPIGYWSVGPYFARKNSDFAPYASVYQNSWKYVARAINWAAKYDIGVLLDLHGAYGSQNGNDHSGIVGKTEFFTAANRKLTTDLLLWLANEIADVTNLVGLQILNEPQDRNVLWTWYNSTMDQIRSINSYTKNLPLYFHDAFNMAKGAQFTATRSDFVVQDYHSYFVYTSSDTSMSANAHTKAISGSLLQTFTKNSATGRRNMIVGEWSCALNPGSLTSSSDKDTDQRNYCLAQQETYGNATAGYHYWAYKLEGCDSNPGWCFKSAMGKYLPSYINTWGFSGYVTNRKILLNLDSSKKVSASIVKYIASLSVSKNSTTGTTNNARVAAVSLDKAGTNGTSKASDVDYSKGVVLAETGATIAPLLDEEKAADDKNSSAKSNTLSRVGMVVSTSSSNDRRGVGSPAARARDAAIERRSSMTAAQLAGYSDGYLSSTYFASSMSSTTPLSRVGFTEQYMQDSWAKRVSWGSTYTKDNYGHYRTHFLSGATTAEAAIVAAVNAANVSS